MSHTSATGASVEGSGGSSETCARRTNAPCPGRHLKYVWPLRVPSVFPLGASRATPERIPKPGRSMPHTFGTRSSRSIEWQTQSWGGSKKLHTSWGMQTQGELPLAEGPEPKFACVFDIPPDMSETDVLHGNPTCRVRIRGRNKVRISIEAGPDLDLKVEHRRTKHKTRFVGKKTS